MIIWTKESFQFPENSENWFMDEIFSTAPPKFAQLYTIMGLVKGKVLLEPASCLSIKEWKDTWSCFRKSTC